MFLPGIIPVNRRLAIGGAKQLAATIIVLSRKGAPTLLLLGADSRNVMVWTRKEYAKKGAALAPSHETSKWIANRWSKVEGGYVRSGHKFSPDWMTRTAHGQIGKWDAQFGFAGIRPRPLWGK